MASTRPLTIADAEVLFELGTQNRAFLAPYQPLAPPGAERLDHYRAMLEEILEAERQGVVVPRVIVDGQRVVGRVTLSNIVRGPLQSCTVGYWVSKADNSRGHATKAVAEIAGLAFDELSLHRVEAGTLLHNAGSQRVLQKNGFEQFGMAPRYLKIAGEWRDHLLFQRLSD